MEVKDEKIEQQIIFKALRKNKYPDWFVKRTKKRVKRNAENKEIPRKDFKQKQRFPTFLD